MEVQPLWSGIAAEAASCTCGGVHHSVIMRSLHVDSGALSQVAPYAKEHGLRHLTLVTDDRTYEAAGRELIGDLQEAGIPHQEIRLPSNARGDVAADEPAIVIVLLGTPLMTDAIVAVGSGTIHDVVRFVACKMQKPFLSVPTAPSVDGFTSVGAPLMIRGDKLTIPAIGPDAIFADLNVLTKAPQPMVAAGFGDMLGKYTSLLDWRFSHLAAGEPYCEAAAAMTRRALQACVDHADEIAERTPEGIRFLMNALIESGFAMLMFGQSHPASGGEHHLSHYWEMEYARLGRKQLLHGAKVGVACAVISRLYKELGERPDPFEGLKNQGKEHQLTAIRGNWSSLQELIRGLPEPETLQALLRKVGGPASPEELGIDEDLLKRSLREAYRIRSRYTMLRAWNEAGHPAEARI